MIAADYEGRYRGQCDRHRANPPVGGFAPGGDIPSRRPRRSWPGCSASANATLPGPNESDATGVPVLPHRRAWCARSRSCWDGGRMDDDVTPVVPGRIPGGRARPARVAGWRSASPRSCSRRCSALRMTAGHGTHRLRPPRSEQLLGERYGSSSMASPPPNGR